MHFSCAEVIPVAAHHDKTGEYPHAVFEKAWELGLVNPHVSSVNTPTAFLILSACLRRNNFRDATISRRALYTLAPSVLDQTMVAYLHAYSCTPPQPPPKRPQRRKEYFCASVCIFKIVLIIKLTILFSRTQNQNKNPYIMWTADPRELWRSRSLDPGRCHHL